jgi:cytosine/uracil/thiamine/allantoin permease
MENKIEDLRGVTEVALVLALSFLFLTIQSVLRPINNWWTIGYFVGFVASAAFFISKSRKAPLSNKAMMITIVFYGIMWSVVSFFS